ncbi:MAG: hypothetical protein M3Q23_03565 [Actinomycetota bacterium]|nr:hypothetical protein [Actinomycetota bacterium]
MRSLRRWALVCSLAAISSASGFVLGSSASPGTALGSGLVGELSAVSALSPTDAWAAGKLFPTPSDIGDFNATTERRHGTGWSRVSSPSPPSHKAELLGVSAVSSSDVWAVGRYTNTTGNDRTLIDHWDGKHWNVVPSPNPSPFGNGLAGVSALSASDVWAVGYSGAPKSLILHWNGISWSQVPSVDPGGGAGNVLSAVSALSSSDVWAVGFYVSGSGPKTLIEHWNGTAWTAVPGVDPSGSDSELTGVSAVSTNDVWAVGYFNARSGDETLVEHWNGTSWSKVASPNVTKESALAAVSGLSSTDAWAVGSSGTATVKTVIEHWDGVKWTKVGSPNGKGAENELLGVSARTAKDVWAVGYSGGNSSHHTLIEHSDGTAWSVK